MHNLVEAGKISQNGQILWLMVGSKFF